MTGQLEATALLDGEAGGARRNMKFTFPPESKPLEGYTIKRGIHRGGFGEVYYALSDAGKEVALKLLQHNLEIELRGVRQCLNLKHPNLVTIFDIRTDGDGDHWIVMEYVSGRSLDRVLDDRGGKLPIEEVQDWLAGMSAGLGFLHDRGIVHRDLKPANIYREDGVVKIGDVGLAKFISQSRRSAQTESVGTVYYMAPEVAHGRYGHEVDIYSLGVVLYEMITGRVPFEGESTAEILMKHLSERPDLTPLPKKLRPVIGRALEKDPMKRTPGVAQLEDEFRRALRGEDIATDIPEDSFVGFDAARDVDPAHREVEQVLADVESENLSGKARKKAIRERLKAARDIRKDARKAAHWARIQEKKAARHARRLERKALKQRQKQERNGFGGDGAARAVSETADSAMVSGGKSGSSESPRTYNSAEPAESGRKEQVRFWLQVAAITIIVLAIFAPGSLPGVVRGVFLGAFWGGVGYGIYWLIKAFSTGGASAGTTGRRGAPSEKRGLSEEAGLLKAASQSQQRPKPAPPPVRVARRALQQVRRWHGPRLSPSTPRLLTARRRITELTGSMTFAVILAVALTAGMALLTPVFGQTPHAGRIMFFGATSLLAGWAVLAVSKAWEGTKVASGHRRFATMMAGVAVGAAAFFLDAMLLVDYARDEYLGMRPAGGLLHELGARSLHQGMQPSIFGYIVFFAGLFLIRHWWRHADQFRRKRFSVGSLLLTALAGAVWSIVCGFPLLWGVMFAGVISCVVQTSAVWVPHEERIMMMEAQAHD